ncbi:MAG: hypothetical protein R2728_14055 [Chitinophagales bacterium]
MVVLDKLFPFDPTNFGFFGYDDIAGEQILVSAIRGGPNGSGALYHTIAQATNYTYDTTFVASCDSAFIRGQWYDSAATNLLQILYMVVILIVKIPSM